MPAAPSVPVPDRITPMLLEPIFDAIELNSTSTQGLGPVGMMVLRNSMELPTIAMSLSGGVI